MFDCKRDTLFDELTVSRIVPVGELTNEFSDGRMDTHILGRRFAHPVHRLERDHDIPHNVKQRAAGLPPHV